MSTQQEIRDSVAFAPYGFVPLSDKVFLPDWGHLVSQDIPFRDGYSGTLDIEVEAKTPIFIRGAEDPQHFFVGPDGKPAIPGSSLRGVLRNVLEIASFGWMRRVNDHRYGVRDLNNRGLYGKHMADLLPGPDGKKRPIPRVIAGWLRKNAQHDAETNPNVPEATIEACHFAKVHYRDLMELKPGYRPGTRQSLRSKYRAWKINSGDEYENAKNLIIKAEVEDIRQPQPDWAGLRFGRVKQIGGGVTGKLVFTGQPSSWDPKAPPRRDGGHPKQHDFFFFSDTTTKPPVFGVDAETMRGFEFVHSDGAQQHSLNKARARNEEWDFWGRAYDKGHPVPVFFLLEGGKKVRAFGLAMMFRLAYKYSVQDAVRNAQKGLGKDRSPDLADLMFGHVPLARKGKGAENEPLLKGRVSVGLCAVTGTFKVLTPVKTVLGAPKASFYPAYIEQDPTRPGAPPRGGKDNYRTFMDDGVRIRGYKRYRVQPVVVEGPPPPTRGDGTVNESVATIFTPLDRGSKFKGTIRFHNLRKAELGALLWALDFGETDRALHQVGMARNLGYGASKITITGHKVLANSPSATTAAGSVDVLQAAREAFVKLMNALDLFKHEPGQWHHSRVVCELQALATPIPENSPHRSQMQIAPDQRMPRSGNQFAEVKKHADVLPTAVSDEDWYRIVGEKVPFPPRSGPTSKPAGAGTQTPAVAGSASPVQGPGTWLKIQGGTKVKVELTGLNKKGSWQAKLVGPEARDLATHGTISGDAPEGAAVGQQHTVIITQGGDRQNLGMKWG